MKTYFWIYVLLFFLTGNELFAQTTCDGPLQVTVVGATSGAPLDWSALTQDVYCTEGAEGYIDLTALGGSPTYQFMWSTGDSVTSDLGNLPKGNYSVTITDGNQCSQIIDLEIQVINPLAEGMNLAMLDACGSCSLTDDNETFFYQDDEFIAQIIDLPNAADLGATQVCTYMRTDLGICGSAPELKRYWQIDAQGFEGRIRLFVTGNELEELAVASGFQNRTEMISQEALCLVRYDGGDQDCQTCTESNVYPLSTDFAIYLYDDTRNVYAIELEVAAFAAFYLQVCNYTVASDFIRLEGQMTNTAVELTWNSNAPDPITSYYVERSMDSVTWEQIAFVEDYADVAEQTYRFFDQTAPRGIIYYRIRQVMKGGTWVFSNAVTILNLKEIALRPLINPFVNELVFELETNRFYRGRFQLFDEVGRLYLTFEQEFDPGIHIIRWDAINLAGTFYVMVFDDLDEAGDQPLSFKLVKTIH